MSARDLRVEVVFAEPDDQALIALDVPPGCDVETALRSSGIYRRFPGKNLQHCPVGIWGRLVARTCVLRDGDRIELYRPLELDPREARRRRAGS
jgi:uncharacterized protein